MTGTRRTALITGSGQNIGRAIAQRLAAEGEDRAVRVRKVEMQTEAYEREVQELEDGGGLLQSASMAMADQQPEDEGEMSGWVLGGTLAVSLLLGVGVFFVLPLLLKHQNCPGWAASA